MTTERNVPTELIYIPLVLKYVHILDVEIMRA